MKPSSKCDSLIRNSQFPLNSVDHSLLKNVIKPIQWLFQAKIKSNQREIYISSWREISCFYLWCWYFQLMFIELSIPTGFLHFSWREMAHRHDRQLREQNIDRILLHCWFWREYNNPPSGDTKRARKWEVKESQRMTKKQSRVTHLHLCGGKIHLVVGKQQVGIDRAAPVSASAPSSLPD